MEDRAKPDSTHSLQKTQGILVLYPTRGWLWGLLFVSSWKLEVYQSLPSRDRNMVVSSRSLGPDNRAWPSSLSSECPSLISPSRQSCGGCFLCSVLAKHQPQEETVMPTRNQQKGVGTSEGQGQRSLYPVPVWMPQGPPQAEQAEKCSVWKRNSLVRQSWAGSQLGPLCPVRYSIC